jgi:ABC-type branched-chain amino acid transport systems, ATPase component
MPGLELSAVNSFYGDAQALFDVDISVRNSEIVAVIGANGAGKTTLLRTITGLVPARSGSMHYGDIDLRRTNSWDMAAAGIAHVPEGRRLFREMNVEENLLMGAYHRKQKSEIFADLSGIYELFPRLGERRRQLAGTLSGGEQQMVALGRALMAKPQLLLLDEPSLGLAPKIVETVFETILSINASGIAVILVEQNAQLALETAQRACLMENGRIVRSAPASELLRDDVVREAYLGL